MLLQETQSTIHVDANAKMHADTETETETETETLTETKQVNKSARTDDIRSLTYMSMPKWAGNAGSEHDH